MAEPAEPLTLADFEPEFAAVVAKFAIKTPLPERYRSTAAVYREMAVIYRRANRDVHDVPSMVSWALTMAAGDCDATADRYEQWANDEDAHATRAAGGA
jgi:hypothetical protein